jgi:hypothetical protein
VNAETGDVREVTDELRDDEFPVEIPMDPEEREEKDAVDAFETHVREASLRLKALAVTHSKPVSPALVRGRLAAQSRGRR